MLGESRPPIWRRHGRGGFRRGGYPADIEVFKYPADLLLRRGSLGIDPETQQRLAIRHFEEQAGCSPMQPALIKLLQCGAQILRIAIDRLREFNCCHYPMFWGYAHFFDWRHF
mgnify:CR=1 FL=1